MSLVDYIPVEILLYIFTHLGVRDLLRCQVVSQRWNGAIANATGLQYRIDLAKLGYKDHCHELELQPQPSVPIVHRRNELQRIEGAWFQVGIPLEQRIRPAPVSIPVEGLTYESQCKLVGDCLCIERFPGMFAIFNLACLRQGDAPIPRCMALNLDRLTLAISRYDWHFDLEHNLLAVVIVTEDSELSVIVLPFNEANAPPVTRRHIFLGMANEVDDTEDWAVNYSIENNFIVIAWSAEHWRPAEQIVVLHWPSEQVIKRFCSFGNTDYLAAKIICGTYLLVIQHDRDRGGYGMLHLDVYRINPQTLRADCIYIYEFPRTNVLLEPRSCYAAWTSSTSLSKIYEPNHAGSLSPVPVMLHFQLGVQGLRPDYAPIYAVFIPLKTLIDLDAPANPSLVSKPKTIPWSLWGPQGSHLCSSQHQYPGNADGSDTHSEHHLAWISGYHALCPEAGEILDFNPHYATRFSPGQPLPNGVRSLGAECFNDKSLLFKDSVHTSLPYLRIPIPAFDQYFLRSPLELLPHSSAAFDAWTFQDSEGIKLVQLLKDPNSETPEHPTYLRTSVL
ncbi:hypothetical protein K474DRAFT_1769071 [Panus rudis PR-1116 ss-1]|nr:hypothetical protein K474DRAFT_1769071 [Panus rudis PR-1116 ss-1]